MAKRKLTAQEKLQLVLESLRGDVKASEMCRQHDIWPTELNRFKQKALQGALEALNSRKGKRKTPKKRLSSQRSNV